MSVLSRASETKDHEDADPRKRAYRKGCPIVVSLETVGDDPTTPCPINVLHQPVVLVQPDLRPMAVL